MVSRPARSVRPRAAIGSLIVALAMLQPGVAGIVLADPASPVSVVKTANPNPVASGDQLTYTIVVTNLGGAKVNDIVLTDQVNGVGVIQNPPALPQLTITSTKGSCSQGGPNGNLVTCNAGSLAGREVWTVTIRGQVTAANGATLNNTASVTGTKSAQTFTTTGSTSVLVSGGTGGGNLPDLTINKTGPTNVALSSPLTYTLTINNVGTANTANVRVVDTLPLGVTLQAPAYETTSLFVCSDDAPADPITVTCDFGAVNQGQNATIKINAISPLASPPTQITNTAVVDPDNAIEESNELNNTSATVNTSLEGPPPEPLLSIVKTDGNPDLGVSWDDGAGPDPVNPGEELVYKIQVVNNATSRADDVRITDTTQFLEGSSLVASQVIVDGAIGVDGGCFVSAPEVLCSIRSLNAGGTMTVTIRGIVIGPAGSNIFNTATVHGNIKNVGLTNTATESTTIRPSIDLTITKADSPDPACARTWPTTTTPNQHLANPPFGLAPASGDIPNDPVVPGPNDGLLAPAVCLGGLTYSFVIGNSGNGPASNVTVRDPLPAGLIFDSYESTAGFVCSVNASNVVTCTGGAIDAASTETLTFMLVAPPNVGSITNTVTVDPNNAIYEPDETNNTDSEATTITTGVDLVIWKGDDKFQADPPDTDGDPTDEDPPGLAPPLTEGFDPIATNGTQTYTIIVDNVGTQDVTGIKVRDVLPAGTAFLSFSATNGFTCTHDGSTYGGNVTCIGGHLLGTASEFYQRPGTPPPAAPGDDRARITIKVFATQFVQPIMHNEVRVDPDNEIVEVNELNNFAFQDTHVGVGNDDQGAFHQLTIDKTQIDPAPVAPVPPLDGFVADPDFTVAQNGILVYDLKVSNLGTDPVSAIVVKDFLPTGSRFIEAYDTDSGPTLSDAFFCFHDGSATGGTVTCVGGDLSGSINAIPDPVLPAKVPTERHIRIKVFAPNTPGTYPNIAVVDPDNVVAEGNEFDNDDAVFTTVTVGGNNIWIDLQIDKVQALPVDDGPVAPGDPLVYQIIVTNVGQADAFDVTVEDVLPSIATYFSAFDAGAPDPEQFTCSQALSVVTCSGATIPAGGSRTINVTLLAPTNIEQFEGGPLDDIAITIRNQAFVDPYNEIPEGNETNNADSEDTVVRSLINLTITKEGPNTAHQNDVTDYVITVTNEIQPAGGTGATAFGVRVVDALPVGLIPLSITADSNFNCQLLENPVNFVDCLGDLTPGEPVTITVHVFVTADGGTLDNEACVDPDHLIDETNELDNCKTKTTEVSPPPAPNLNINKSASTGTVTPGETFTYTVTVSNIGDDTAPTGIQIVDTLPSEVTFVSVNATNGFTCAEAAGVVTCDDPGTGLPAGQATVVTIEVTVNGGVTNSFTNFASVNDTGGTETASVTTNVGGTAVDLILSDITDVPDPATVGQNLTYTFSVSNGGTNASGAFEITAQMDDTTGLTFVGATASQGFTCADIVVDPVTFVGIVTCSGAGLPAGQTTEVKVEFTVSGGTPSTHELAVKADSGEIIVEASEANNEDTEATSITGALCTACIDLVIGGILDTPDPVTDGQALTYIVTASNVGDIPTTGMGPVSVRFYLPIGVAFVSAAATAGFSCTYVDPFALGVLDYVDCTGDLLAGQGVVVTVNTTANDSEKDTYIGDGDQTIASYAIVDEDDVFPEGTGAGDEFTNANNGYIYEDTLFQE